MNIDNIFDNPDYQQENKINGNSSHKVAPAEEYVEYAMSHYTEEQKAALWNEYILQINIIENIDLPF